MKRSMIRWLGVGVLCAMFSVAQATIQQNLDARMTEAEAVANAVAERTTVIEIVEQLIAAGVDAANTAGLVIAAIPGAAIEVATAVMQAAPNVAAADVALAMTTAVPSAATDIVFAVAQIAPEAASDIVLAVMQAAPQADVADIATAVTDAAPEAVEAVIASIAAVAPEAANVVAIAVTNAATSRFSAASVAATGPQPVINGGSNAPPGLVFAGKDPTTGEDIFIIINTITGVSTGIKVVESEQENLFFLAPGQSGKILDVEAIQHITFFVASPN